MFLKNVKKFVFSLLVFVLIVSFASEPVNAKTSTQNETLNEKSTKVNIDEKGIPEEVKEVAKSQYLPRVAALDGLSEKKESSYTLGEPFKIYKFNYKSDGNYYFPVLDKEDNVVYVVTISQKIEKDKTASQSGKYTVNVSPFLARILNQYENQKITILTNTKGYFVLTEDDEIKPVLKTPLTNENQSDIKMESPKNINSGKFKQTSTVTEPIKKFESTKLEVQKQYINKLKNFKIRETQGNNGWCAGYTMSALLNATYNTDRYNAKAVMRYLHPNLQGEAFQFTGLTPQEMMRFGQSQNRQVEFLNRMPSYNEIDNLTKSNKGIAILGRRIESTNGIHAGHAMAVVGNAKLENGQEVIIIWNPWDHGFMTQDAKSNIIPVSNGDHYNWNSSIYGY
ncbi:cysteine protease [Staphylococcus aureus]|uniref:C47 family peptidase n=1 Tax=Staphylococcus aureus TaxID=1280 RepID=UPI0013A6D967|nr:C47 family peptidase [Staphylococcus aureus]NDR17394.1 cysteine protease [Staphylococcus aureus]